MISRRREQQDVLRDMMSALAVCNNVTPVESGPVPAIIDQDEQVEVREIGMRASMVEPVSPQMRSRSLVDKYQMEHEPQLEASSPDEVALVKCGFAVGMSLMERQRESCTL